MRAFKELVEDAQLMQDFERGRMDRVAAKIAKKIPVLLEDDDCHAGTRQEPAQHHAGGTAARDRTLDLHDRSLPDISNVKPELWRSGCGASRDQLANVSCGSATLFRCGTAFFVDELRSGRTAHAGRSATWLWR